MGLGLIPYLDREDGRHRTNGSADRAGGRSCKRARSLVGFGAAVIYRKPFMIRYRLDSRVVPRCGLNW